MYNGVGEVISMAAQLVHLRHSEVLAICGAPLGPENIHPAEISEETERILTCPKCREIAIAPHGIEHRAGSFML